MCVSGQIFKRERSITISLRSSAFLLYMPSLWRQRRQLQRREFNSAIANASTLVSPSTSIQIALLVVLDRGLEPARDECDHEEPSGGGVGIAWPVCWVPRDETEKAVGDIGRRLATPANATCDTPDSVIGVSPSSPSSDAVRCDVDLLEGEKDTGACGRG